MRSRLQGPPRTRSRPSGVSARAGGGRLVHQVACCFPPLPPRTASGQRRSPSVTSSASPRRLERSAEEVAKRCRSPRFRGGAFFPARDRTARSAGVWPARPGCGPPNVGVFEVALRGSGPAPAGLRRGDARPLFWRARARWRWGGQQRGRVALSQPAHGHLEPHGDHRAGPGRVGGGRLDRGECITDSRAMLHYLHDPGRAHRLRLGRGPDRLRRPAGRLHRARPRGRRPGDLRPALVLPGARGPLDRARVGGPIDVSPTHLRW